MTWVELSAKAEAEAVESISELFNSLGHGGVAIEEPLSPSSEPGQVEVDPGQLVTIKTYLPDDDRVKEAIDRAEKALWHLSQLRRIEPLVITRLAEEDWAEAWKNYFFVQRIGERTVIKPSWRDYQAKPDEVVLELDPGMAFGTGLHPTTRMCLLACERFVASEMRVLDLGTGSGILAISAAKQGVASVLALDVDPVAVTVARKNVEMNGLSDRIEVQTGSIEAADTGPYDLVLANIIARVLIELAQHLCEAVTPGGLLIASGIIADREVDVRNALEAAGLRIREVMVEGDWRTMVCERGHA